MTQAQPLRHVWQRVNGVRLHCVTAGQGPLLLLLHGFPECWLSWRHQIPALARHWRIVAPDLRGYTTSDKPKDLRAYAPEALVEDLNQLIGAFDAEQATVIGHDWGGVLAWSLALAQPARVERLVMINAPHPRAFIQHLLTNPRQIGRSSYALLFQLPRLPEALLRLRNFHAFDLLFRRTTVRAEAFPADVLAAYRAALAQPGALTAALNYYRAARRYGLSFWLALDPVVRQPTLLIWGERDPALGRELNNNLERYVPRLQRFVLPEAGHWIHEEFPERVNRAILEFLQQGGREA